MKIIIRLSLMCFIFASCSKDSQSDPTPPPPNPIPDTLTTGWTKAGTGIPNTASVSDVFFTTASSGYVTTDQGIYRSSDGGVTWSIFNSINTPFNIGGLGNRYCFVGNDNRIHYTNDGTDFFSKSYLLASPATATLGFFDCFVASPTVIYACSGRYIYKSVNGGANFDSIYVFPSRSSYAIFFTSETNGWLIRSDSLYHTTNAGSNWTPVHALNNIDVVGSIDFLDANTGICSDGRNVYKTTNAGVNWTTVFSSLGFGYIDVDMVSSTEFYFSVSGKIYRTVNAGTSFTQVLSSGQNGIIEIHFIDANNGWACGNNGALYKYKP